LLERRQEPRITQVPRRFNSPVTVKFALQFALHGIRYTCVPTARETHKRLPANLRIGVIHSVVESCAKRARI
jgi:hypothetical protein